MTEWRVDALGEIVNPINRDPMEVAVAEMAARIANYVQAERQRIAGLR